MHSESLATRKVFGIQSLVCHQQLQRRLSIFPASPRMKTVLAIHFLFFFFVFLLFPLAEEIRDFFAKFSRHPITAVTLSSAEIIDLFFRARANESLGNYGTSSDSSQRYTRRALEFQAAGLQEKWISMLTQKPRMTARSHSECVTWTWSGGRWNNVREEGGG